MNKLYLFCQLALVFSFTGFSTFAQDLKLATFNCEFLIKKKVHLKYGLPFRMSDATADQKKLWTDAYRDQQFENATVKVADHLLSLNADVIGLTEVGGNAEVELLVNKLNAKKGNYKYWKVCKSADRSTGQHVAILSRYPITEFQEEFTERGLYFKEADLDEEGETGMSKALRAQINANGRMVQVFVFHFKSERGGEESDQQRLMHAEIGRRVTLPYINKGEFVVVMGDLNSEMKHPVLRRLRGFDDVYQELIQTGSSNYFKSYETRWTYKYKGVEEQIDHILLSLNFRKECLSNGKNKWGIQTVIVPTPSPEISDHNALTVELNFRE